jgi:exopolysaccharide biosynthesis predicted pyruvyltransferase EpsI
MTPLDIEVFLRDLAREPLFYFPNPGNAGDSLIALATFQLFRKLAVPFTLPAAESFDSTEKVVVWGGGGNLVPMYSHERDFVLRHHETAKRLVLLPQSISGHEDVLGRLGRNVTIICREPVSYAHVARHAPKAEVLLAHDLVLSLDVAAALKRRPSFTATVVRKLEAKRRDGGASARNEVSPTYFLRDWAFLTEFTLDQARRGFPRELNAFRTDAERTGPVPPHNCDLSRQFEWGCHSEALASYVSYRFLSVIRKFDRINTNRLHVCLGAALLGKQVRLFANSYYKVRTIYEFSLADRFPHIQWMSDS